MSNDTFNSIITYLRLAIVCIVIAAKLQREKDTYALKLHRGTLNYSKTCLQMQALVDRTTLHALVQLDIGSTVINVAKPPSTPVINLDTF